GTEAGEQFCKQYNITDDGNFAGKNIPNLIEVHPAGTNTKQIQLSRKRLFERRKERVHPEKDDKILTSWNGLIIVAFAKAGRVFQDEEYITTAKQAHTFIENQLMKNGRLMARYRDGEVKH